MLHQVEMPRLAKLIFRFWGDARGVAKEFHEAAALGFSRTLLEKVSSRFHDTNFFRDGGSDPLVQGDTVLFREALGGPLDGVRKLQWISSSTHGYILLKASIGRKTETRAGGRPLTTVPTTDLQSNLGRPCSKANAHRQGPDRPAQARMPVPLLARKQRNELAGGEIVEGAEVAGELVKAQAAVAVEPAEKLFGGLGLSDLH